MSKNICLIFVLVTIGLYSSFAASIQDSSTAKPVIILQVSTIEQIPFVKVYNGNEIHGFTPDFMKLLGEVLGFQYRLFLAPNGTVDGLIDNVAQRKTDFAIANIDTLKTTTDNELVNFTRSIITDKANVPNSELIMLFPKGSPFYAIVNDAIVWLKDNGEVERIKKKFCKDLFVVYIQFIVIEELGKNWKIFFASQNGFILFTFHLLNMIKFYVFYYALAHINILAASLMWIHLYILFCKSNWNYQIILKNSLNLVKMLNVGAFQKSMVETLRYLQLVNRHCGLLFFIYLLFNCPTNAMVNVVVFVIKLSMPQRMFVAALIASQICCIFQMHFVMAYFYRHLKRPNQVLIHCFVGKLHRVGNFRAKMQHSILIQSLHSKKSYGFTYDRFGLISLAAFGKYLLLYGEFLMTTGNYWINLVK